MAGLNRLQAMDYSVVQQCMHCGMCLPDCPTYATTGRERNSPRGRIALMRAVADGELPLDTAFGEEMQYCLGCLACQSACPADVDYAQLLEQARAQVEDDKLLASLPRSFYRWVALEYLFRRPWALRLMGTFMRLFQRSGLESIVRVSEIMELVSPRWDRLLTMAPRIGKRFSHHLIAENESPPNPRYRVALLTGCVQDLAYASVNRDTADVLLANDCAVWTPPVQFCCGSIHAHNGSLETARAMARRNLDQFDPEGVDAIITNSGGCGSHLKHFGRLLEDDDAYASRARVWDARVKDIHQWLVATGWSIPAPGPGSGLVDVTYHASCHLHHGQRVRDEPRQILRSIPGLRLVDLPEATWCCGSAGIYSVTQPEESERLLRRKIDHIRTTGATVLAMANPGCDLQIRRGLAEAGLKVEVTTPVSLLAAAYRRDGGGNTG